MTTKINFSYIALCKPGLAPFCVKELEQFSAKNIKEHSENVIFDSDSAEQLKNIFQKLGTAFSLSQIVWQGEEISNLIFSPKMFEEITDFFLDMPSEIKFRILCEGISGNETRISLSSEINKILTTSFEKHGVKAIVDYKNPELIFSLSLDYSSKLFTFGIKLHQTDLDKRDWRVYTHKASFRGDFASAICQSIGIGEKPINFTSFFSRDGAIAVEAACRILDHPIRPLSKTLLKRFPNQISSELILQNKILELNKINLIDDSSQNIRAAVNNAKLAGVNDSMKYIHSPLDEIDTKIARGTVDFVIVQMTSKDERRINEILKQVRLMLVSKEGIALFITRVGFEISSDSHLSLLWHKLIPRGSGSISLCCLQKKD